MYCNSISVEHLNKKMFIYKGSSLRASSYTDWKDVKTKAFRNIKKIILVFSGKQGQAISSLLNISSRCDYLGNCSFYGNETFYLTAYNIECEDRKSLLSGLKLLNKGWYKERSLRLIVSSRVKRALRLSQAT